ncbi:DUF4304 domain-containing protein [Grimontia sp. SpTr1]|uniref:DUF4304 domain-containing protein n=1 Tax=Grimontia sp. SpTr1 TaxID=2995319 RepID=UPI00248C66D9|nr:DUF4304 domain-containing protein [Grimontia sp. SpTr1]
MSEISKKIDEIVKLGLTPLLKTHGFKKKARNFYRQHEDRIDLINVQASQFNTGKEGQFTVNVGVYFPAISAITDAPAVKGMPKEYDCTARERIGLLSSENKDTWWSVDNSVDINNIAAELALSVESLCLPWLAKMADLENLKLEAAKKIPFIAAGISLHQGNQSEAKAYLELIIKQKPLAKSRSIAWGKKHGLV